MGNRSRYQLIMLIYFTLLWVEITYMLLGSPYIFMNPVFRCNSFDEEVTEADACDIIDEC